jgi:hypothetical protein
MASTDFKTILVKDSTIAGISDQLTYAVKSGASSKTYQAFPSVSNSSSTLTFNVQVPSENVIVDREVFIRTKIYFTITETTIASGSFAGGYGSDYALQAFPLNHLFTTASATINNSNVSSNIQDILPQILQMMSQEELSAYDGMTPNLVDYNCAKYSEALGSTNDVISTTSKTGYNKYFTPRGSFTCKVVSKSRKLANGDTANNTLESTATTNIFKIAYEVEVTEPIIGLSPFIYGHPLYSNQGLVGISAMNFVFNLDATAKRFLSCGAASTKITKIELGRNVDGTAPDMANTTLPFADAELLVCFLSSQPRDMIKSRNVCNYTDAPRFISTPNVAIATGGATKELNTNNIQLNQLPDLFVIQVRLPMANMTIHDAEYGCAITGISVNLNNSSGLLSTMNAQQLWALSVKNGSKQSWGQFSGQTNVFTTRNATNAGIGVQPTTGSLLVLSPTDLSLPDYLAPGCIGSYNFQAKITCAQHTGASITPEVVVMCVNSGIFVTTAGSSQIFTGILTKAMCEEAKAMSSVNPVMSVEYNRVLGGGVHGDMAACACKEMPAVKEAMKQKVKLAQMYGSGAKGGAYTEVDKFSGMMR